MTSLWHYTDDRTQVRKLCVGSYENNVFVVACRATGAAVVIDAAAEPDRVVAAVAGLEPVAILTTHGHFDHVGAAAAVRKRLGIPFRLAAADAKLAGLDPDVPLEEGTIQVGELELTALATPGHTAGSYCFTLPGMVFTGDTLFPGGPGATGGRRVAFDQIIAAIEQRLLTLPESTLVFPGHGLDTTIGTEAPSLADWRRRGW